MKKISAIILTAAILLTMTGCDRAGNSSDIPNWSVDSGQSSGETSNGSDELSDMPEWDYVSLVRDNYKKYFVASSSPVDGLPNVANNLLVRSLETAVKEDSAGKMRGLLEKFSAEPSLSERVKLTDEILNLLCKTDEITKQNEFFSPKKLAILEGFWGTGDKLPEPTTELTAEPLEEAYKYLTERYCMAIIGSQVLEYVDLIRSKKGDDGKYHLDMEEYNKRVFEDYGSGKLTGKQLADNTLYLAYYGVFKDRDLNMLDEFRAYAAANSPDSLAIINAAANEAAALFSGINDVVITEVKTEGTPTTSDMSDTSSESSTTGSQS